MSTQIYATGQLESDLNGVKSYDSSESNQARRNITNALNFLQSRVATLEARIAVDGARSTRLAELELERDVDSALKLAYLAKVDQLAHENADLRLEIKRLEHECTERNRDTPDEHQRPPKGPAGTPKGSTCNPIEVKSK
ncbi:hypothetical protein G7068_15890 [Leucobacter viscericola]|uniref:Uncharacterized protein n=1 Tax=Leucobacter viscericola TaxID=2714935 RepID=A0A6G7XJH4_9MICO|nr:hypothetical protein [Leucobacter viscericola]QIK64527.1 hypothetical protein G7068_15890 [Leucobacter viscericola]